MSRAIPKNAAAAHQDINWESKTVLMEDHGIELHRYSVGSNDDEDGIVLLLRLNRGPNVFNPTMTKYLHQALDVIEQDYSGEDCPNKCLIITGSEQNKFFSNGLDLDYFTNHSGAEVGTMINNVWTALARILVMECYTFACMNGHAFGAGLFLALACDYRVMRTQRGYCNFPEVNLGMHLAKGFAELCKAKVPLHTTLSHGILTGKRYSSAEAVAAQLIDHECPIDTLLPHTIQLAVQNLPRTILSNRGHLFNPTNLTNIKIELYTDAYRALTSGQFNAPPTSRL